MNSNTKKTLLAAALVFFAASLRLVDHPFNATPLVAVILFSAAIFKEWSWKIGVPVIALVGSDALIELKNGYGFHSSTVLVYMTFALIFLIGYFMLKKKSFIRILTASTVASIVFFLITNFALFYPAAAVPNPTLGNYPHNWTGIMASYQAGLPFYKNMFVGDLLFTGIIFGAFYLISQAAWFSKKQIA
jgi:hypothetical protein